MKPKIEVRRLDENPNNFNTYKTWVLVSDSFETVRDAIDYVRRASGPTQKLKVVTDQGEWGLWEPKSK